VRNPCADFAAASARRGRILPSRSPVLSAPRLTKNLETSWTPAH
jgi:hypothetical protein